MSDLPNVKLKKLEEAGKQVKVCRDFFEGSVAVVNQTYLPKWVGESDEKYKIRQSITPFSNLYSPIITGLAGMATKKEPVQTDLDDFNFEDVDLRNNSLNSFIKDVAVSSLVAGIEFIAVQSSKEKNRAYLKRYKYEDLYSYSVDEDGKLNQIVFKDVIEIKAGNFGIEERERFVVFAIGGGQVWYSEKEGEDPKKQSEWTNTLDEIPVAYIKTGKEKTRFDILPKMYDIAMLNKVALNLESGLGNVLSVVSNPVPIFFGELDDDDDGSEGEEKGSVKIGVEDALIFGDKTKEGMVYVEIEGKGVKLLENKTKAVAEEIDKLSFSFLQRNDSKTVVDAQENQARSGSFLTDIATSLESAFNDLLRWWALIENRSYSNDAGMEFKKDFDDVLFSDSQLKILYDLVSSGDLSRETFWAKLKMVNVLPKDFDATSEKERIESEI